MIGEKIYGKNIRKWQNQVREERERERERMCKHYRSHGKTSIKSKQILEYVINIFIIEEFQPTSFDIQ